MRNIGNKLAAGAIAGLLITLPVHEGGVGPDGAKPYKDVGGVLTVCWGHTKNVQNRHYSREECEKLLTEDIKMHMESVDRCITREPTKNQLIAFVSHDFNTGGWCSSRSRREFNAGNDLESCRALAYAPDDSPVWAYVKGVFYRGLHKRRIEEMNQCRIGLSG